MNSPFGNPEFNRIIGEIIKDRIQQSDFRNMERFCAHCQIPKSTLSEILNGKNDVKLSTIAKIAGGLKTTVSQMLKDIALDEWVREDAAKLGPRKPKKVRRRAKRTPMILFSRR